MSGVFYPGLGNLESNEVGMENKLEDPGQEIGNAEAKFKQLSKHTEGNLYEKN